MKRTKSISKPITKLNRPSVGNPELVKGLVHIHGLSKKLYEATKQEKIAKMLGMTQQAVDYHAKKEQV